MDKRKPTLRGVTLFSDSAAEPKSVVPAWRANIDGGSRGNPGPASYGVVIRDQRGEIAAKLKKYIGRTTNNVAEYYALIAALDYAQSHNVRTLRVESDSELLVKQMRGHYKVKSADLRPLHERATKMTQAFESFRIEHVYREQNAEADGLANEAMDEAEGRPLRTASSAAKAATSNSPMPAALTSKTPVSALSPKVSATDMANAKVQIPRAGKREPHRFRARYRGGVLYLLEDVNLPEGEEVELLIRPLPKP
jgi:ribonuclease HI